MKILTLQITRENLDKILDGSKPEEYREITPKNAKKYIVVKNQGEENESVELIKYDAIQFLNGMKTNRPRVLIEIKTTEMEILEDEDGNEIVFEENGEEYILAQMIYGVGKVLERENI